MASLLYVTEYRQLAQTGAQAAQAPAMVEQRIDYSGGHTESAAFGASTRIIRVHTDSICSISIAVAPVATTSMARMAAGQTEYYGVVPGQKISAVINT